MKASDFYLYNITSKEKQRIDKLELFDEYEPWHLKCSHYTIIAATRGNYLTQLAANLYNPIQIPLSLLKMPMNVEAANSYSLKIQSFDLKFGMRYGHKICVANSKMFIFGGFGELINDQSGKHMRHSTMEIVDLKTMSVSVMNQIENLNG